MNYNHHYYYGVGPLAPPARRPLSAQTLLSLPLRPRAPRRGVGPGGLRLADDADSDVEEGEEDEEDDGEDLLKKGFGGFGLVRRNSSKRILN